MRAINNPICVHISKLTILFSSYAPNWLFFPLKKILALLLFSCELVLTDYILHLNIRFPRVGNISTYDSAYQKCMCLHGAQSSLIFVTQETVAHQSPLFIEFFRQKSWSRLPFPTPGIFLTQGWYPCLLYLLHCQVDSLPLYYLESLSSTQEILNKEVLNELAFCTDIKFSHKLKEE